MRVVRNTSSLQYTNFIFTNDSWLDKEEKIKCYFLHFYFYFTVGKIGWGGTVKQIN